MYLFSRPRSEKCNFVRFQGQGTRNVFLSIFQAREREVFLYIFYIKEQELYFCSFSRPRSERCIVVRFLGQEVRYIFVRFLGQGARGADSSPATETCRAPGEEGKEIRRTENCEGTTEKSKASNKGASETTGRGTARWVDEMLFCQNSLILWGSSIVCWQCAGLLVSRLSDRSCTRGIIHNKLISLSQLVTAQYSLTVQNRGLKHHLFH